ncbi:alpha/beta fold hydrolase [Streptomyces polyrhachis]|uniref:Alpha/beta fold hydrolase n=1 Tax=Streptomyces polyrhachis TaxID=1282885 RepID=A0ABW2GC17_9ACTN
MFRTRAIAALATAVISLAGLLTATTTAQAADPSGAPAPPPFTDSHGLTVVPRDQDPRLDNARTPADPTRDFTLTVTTPEVKNPEGGPGHHIRVTLPEGYHENPGKRYPVLYLLHGSPGDPCGFWDKDLFPGLDRAKDTAGMIVVMLPGGASSWYANWRDQNTPSGAQNWENFAVQQAVPFIDANLRTLADKQHRAIAGISMGGFGAAHLAQRHPELFSHVGTISAEVSVFSGLSILRFVMWASTTVPNPAGYACAAPGAQNGPGGVDALFGGFFDIAAWSAIDPTSHVADYRSMDVSIYSGDGRLTDIPQDLADAAEESPEAIGEELSVVPIGRVGEFLLNDSANEFEAALRNDGQKPYRVAYGDGAGWSTPGANPCEGEHNPFGSCWDRSIVDLMERLQRQFEGTGGVGPITGAFGLCADVAGGSVRNGTTIQLTGCNGAPAQTWTVGHGNTVRAFTKCMNARGGGTADATYVQLNDCDGSGAQEWVRQSDGRLRNPQSGRCLTPSTRWWDFGKLMLWSCSGGDDQKWGLPART